MNSIIHSTEFASTYGKRTLKVILIGSNNKRVTTIKLTSQSTSSWHFSREGFRIVFSNVLKVRPLRRKHHHCTECSRREDFKREQLKVSKVWKLRNFVREVESRHRQMLILWSFKLFFLTCKHLDSRHGMQLFIPLVMMQSFLPDLEISLWGKTRESHRTVLPASEGGDGTRWGSPEESSAGVAALT